ncbi:MAG TPA: PhoU domain-containing protein [Terriglobales bacterium]|nr:PhoU domain-containing protein [Terriglobales bacterium]
MARSAVTMKQSARKETDSTRELRGEVQQACLVARDAAFNFRDFINGASKMALLAVKDCEKELDRIERSVDEKIAGAITEVTEAEASELLACLKFIIDLERIGDLIWSATKRLRGVTTHLARQDSRDLMNMAGVLQEMLDRIHQGFVEREVEPAAWVMQQDSQIDTTCQAFFRRHLAGMDRRQREYSTNLLFIAQALERAGDHCTNLAEEIYHLVEGHSLRHEAKRRKPQA